MKVHLNCLMKFTVNMERRICVNSSFAEQNAARFTRANLFLLDRVSLRLLEKTIDVHHLEVLWLSQAEARDFNLINSF